MAENYLSGKTGSVGVATVTGMTFGAGLTGTGSSGSVGTNTLMSFGEWRIPMEAGTPEISNFNTAPYRAYVPGLIGASAETDCPGYNQGNMPLTCGGSYQLTLGWTNSLNIVVWAILKKLEPANKVDGAPTIKASWQITGGFAASVA